ncbi:hypothetical protein OEZ85_014051 [Tetradesmus obliquus]|uniref:Uncharacterized protein n=1 Tax=Tetradesmus obliquus TaxID=3088 RepID=A0ABY8U6T8_TETOB|nr:hypothetical protein OEZ85_014051 [Tetradesmus obliquus]
MLSAAAAGVSAGAARLRCPGSTTCFAKQKAQGVTALRHGLPRSCTATPAALGYPTGLYTSSRRAWSCKHRLQAARGAVGVLLDQLPDFSFDECMQEVLLCAAPSTTQEQRSAAVAKLAACRELIGENCASPGHLKREYAAKAFALDSSGLPTGEMYVDSRGRPSVTAFEQRTSRKPAKKYRVSCIIIRDGQPARYRAGWLKVESFLVDRQQLAAVPHLAAPSIAG